MNMNALPKISVVTCSYNQGRFLEETIRSVLDQGYGNLEYIIIDGGSTDESVDIIRRYADRLAYWVSEPDAGQTDALIKGFRRATGDIEGWLCSDDLLEPGALHEVAAYFRENPGAEAVYGDATLVGIDGTPLRPKKEHPFNRFIWLHAHNFIPQPSMFWRRDLYERVGGLDPRFDAAMDADLWIRFAEVTEIRHVRRRWSRMRHYPEQKNRRLRALSDREDGAIRQRYVGHRSPLTLGAAGVMARGLRVGWKAVTGCYW